MDIKNSKLRLIYLFGFFLILALPLLNIPPWFSPPDWGKTIVFRIILSLLIFVFLWQILSKKNSNTFPTIVPNMLQEPKRFLAFWLLIALFVIFLLATIFSLDRYYSFWGDPYRSGGFLNFAFYIIFAILAFLILNKKDWQKIWDFSIGIGILVSFVAILQQFKIFAQVLVPYGDRPLSTLGNPIFLAIYLLLLTFLALALAIRKGGKKRFFYLFSFFLFLFVIFLTQTRAAFIGLTIGFFWFLFFYPKKLLKLKISALILLIFLIFGFYFLKTHPEVSLFPRDSLPQKITERLLTTSLIGSSRVSAWKVSLQALKDRPVLGYGPENFSIAFDKYYDPSLPGILRQPGEGSTDWWDRAHNFVFEISLTAGLGALLVYLSLFLTLFWQLQKLKKKSKESLIAHGLQATFLGYLAANFFSFDVFSTYLISFLLIGYSLKLVSQLKIPPPGERGKEKKFSQTRISKLGRLILFSFLILLIWFIWAGNLKPLKINKETYFARHCAKYEYRKCKDALKKMERVLPSHSFLDQYLRLEYVDAIGGWLKVKPEEKFELAQKAARVLRENIKIRPYYTRNWLFLGAYTNYLIEEYQKTQPALSKELEKETNFYFKQAEKLSPKRPELFEEWVKYSLIVGSYQKAKEKAQRCIELKSDRKDCWWLLGLSQIPLGEKEKAKENIEIAGQNGYSVDSKNSLLQLAKMYSINKNYSELVEIYQKLIKIEPQKPQYHGSLATCYKELGLLEKAREEAFRILEIAPEFQEQVEIFLRELP